MGLPKEVQAFATCKMIEGFQISNKTMRHDAAKHAVAVMYAIIVEELVNPPDRRMMYIEARGMIFFYLRITGWRCLEIARAYGRDHSSVIHNTKKFRRQMSFSKSPERIGLIKLLNECGHIPSLIVNTIPGTEYLDEIFDKEDYEQFFNLNLKRYDELLKQHNRRKLIAKLKQEKTTEDINSTYFSRIRSLPLDTMYHRSYKTHKRNANT